MEASTSDVRPTLTKKSMKAPTTLQVLSCDILFIIFSFLDFADLLRCSAVCKSWFFIIDTSKLFQILYCKQQGNHSMGLLDIFNCPERLSNKLLKELAMDRHRFSLQEGSIDIYQWKAHLAGVNRCRMKRELVLTGGGDKVMRLWSVESFKCLDEYFLPDAAPLIDFDFDESKIVGLVGTRVCIWRRDGKRSILSSREGKIPKGSCMCYVDPEAVVGCQDGRARVFDMYSRKWTKIIKVHDAPVTCLSFSNDQMIVSGSTIGSITITDLSSDQRVATLKAFSYAGTSTLRFNPSSPLLFAGSSAGKASCWDLRTMRSLWQTRVSPNVIYSIQHLRNYTSTLVMGGIDGVLRVIDQNTGEVLSCCILAEGRSGHIHPKVSSVIVQKRKAKRIAEETRLDIMHRACRPSINCLAVGYQKVVTTSDDNHIRVWKFNASR